MRPGLCNKVRFIPKNVADAKRLADRSKSHLQYPMKLCLRQGPPRRRAASSIDLLNEEQVGVVKTCRERHYRHHPAFQASSIWAQIGRSNAGLN